MEKPQAFNYQDYLRLQEQLKEAMELVENIFYIAQVHKDCEVCKNQDLIGNLCELAKSCTECKGCYCWDCINGSKRQWQHADRYEKLKEAQNERD